MRLTPTSIGLISSVLLSTVCRAADVAPWLPPPGEYKIDSTTTTRWHTQTGLMERVEQVDGETGQATVTQRAPGAPAPVVTTVPGKGPIRQCQIAAAPPVPRGGSCAGKLSASGDSASASVPCEGQEQQFDFQKVSLGVWEKRIRMSPSSAPAPGGLPPQAAAAMAPVVAKMEARAKEAPPAEAAALRQQIAAIQRGGGPASNGPQVETVQRWTWVSNQCTARQ